MNTSELFKFDRLNVLSTLKLSSINQMFNQVPKLALT